MRLEIVCLDECAETIVEGIYKSLHTGQRGDGKIFVLPVSEAMRIKTGERGKDALRATPASFEDENV